MSTTREYEINTGEETADLPVEQDPTQDTDFIVKGYADNNYQQGGLSVADATALKAVTEENRKEGDVRLVTALGTEFWFDADSTETNNDTTVIQPTVGSGRWLAVSGSGGSSSSGSSGINYLALTGSHNAETDIGNWIVYEDAVQDTPVDGGGGTPVVTFERNETDPLRETADFKFSKPINQQQGEGASVDFFIHNADKQNFLEISFDFDGTGIGYQDGDLRVFAYDIFGAELIIPNSPQNGYQLRAEKYRPVMRFLASSETQTAYRLMIHVATNNGSPYEVFFDNFSVGPSQRNIFFDGIWKTYQNTTDYTLTTDAAATVSFVKGDLKPEKDTDGNWTISGNIALNHGSDTSFVVSIPGVIFKNVTDFRQAITTQELSAGRARALPNTSNIEVNYSAAASFTSLSLNEVQIESKPTWANFDPPNYYMNDSVIQANLHTTVCLTSSPSVNTNDQIPYDTVETFKGTDMWSGAPNYEMVAPVDGTYEYSVNFRTGDGNSIAIVQTDTGSGFVNGKRSIFGINASSNLESTLELKAGDKVRVVHVTGVPRQYTSDYNSFTFRRMQEFSAGQPVGFGIANETQAGLTTAEIGNKDITSGSSISGSTNVVTVGTLGLATYSRIGRQVTVSFNITGTVLTAADTLSDIVFTVPTEIARTTAIQRTAVGSYWQSSVNPRVRFGPVIANTASGTNSWIIRGFSDSTGVQSITGTFTYSLDW